jgi:DNA topoisomerase III
MEQIKAHIAVSLDGHTATPDYELDCTLTIFRNKCDKQLSDKQIVELATKRKTGLIKGFKGKNGKAFDASLVLDEQFNIGFSFPEKKAKPKK